MIYIKAFFRGFWSTIETIIDPKSKVDLIYSLSFYGFCFLVSLFSAQWILSAAWAVGIFNVVLNYLHNNGKVSPYNKWLAISSLILNLGVVAACIYILIS
jgi:hypothetical protein